MTRKLATVRKIASLTPIEGADMIELAYVDGWPVVSQKGIHNVGDLVIFFEVDSLLPEIPEFEFLRERCYVKESQEGSGFRLKTIRLRGQYSQGMIVPIKDISHLLHFDVWPELLKEGTDVTEWIGVKKYEKIIPAQLAGMIRGNFPGFLKKTDQERCLEGDAIVSTIDGDLTIKQIVENKMRTSVWSYNEITKIIELKPIVDWSTMTRKSNWVKITTKSGLVLVCTKNHKIWCEDLGAYREAQDIEVGQKFIKKTEDNSVFFINSSIDNKGNKNDTAMPTMSESS